MTTTTTPSRGYVLALKEGVDGRGPDVKCSDASTGGSLALYRSVLDGDGPPPHRHRHEDETIVVLDGTVEVECGSDRWRGGPGTTFFMQRGLMHTFRSIDGPATLLLIVTPGHLDEFFSPREQTTDPAEVAALASRFF